jgi:hypothetical protein
MTENDAQKPDDSPPVRSNAQEEGSEPVEEPDQRWPGAHEQGRPRDEKIRWSVLGIGLLSVILSYLFFCLTGNVFALFVTIVVVYVFYHWLDGYLSRQCGTLTTTHQQWRKKVKV